MDNTTFAYDFSGYATKSGLKCTDGRTILPGAFKHQDGQFVPMVFMHQHADMNNILGRALLEHRADGMYAYGAFNNTPQGVQAKEMVQHGDLTWLSIFANGLVESGKQVAHGDVRELSLVLAGANPGARIDNIAFAHSDGSLTGDFSQEEALIYTGIPLELAHAADAAEEAPTAQQIFDSMTEDQKNLMYAIVGTVAPDDADEDSAPPASAEHSDKNVKEDPVVKHNVFDNTQAQPEGGTTLTHAQMVELFDKASEKRTAKSFRENMKSLAHANEYGITNIEALFPEFQLIRPEPDRIGRDDIWVADVMSGISRTPFSRIRSMYMDFTESAARAKGYITGNRKYEEVYSVATRTTSSARVYSKQKLNKDDIEEITGFDVVAYVKRGMRGLLEEEIARAILIGDGRLVNEERKIKTDNIRPIWTDDDFYSHKVLVAAPEGADPVLHLMDEVVRARKNYKGSGSPTLFTTVDVVSDMLLIRNALTGERLYKSEAELLSAMRVAKIVEVEVMENQTREVGAKTHLLKAIMVNLRDYTVGADRGGQVGMFEDFDIDFNQMTYLLETKCSGALTKWKSAVVFETETVAPLG